MILFNFENNFNFKGKNSIKSWIKEVIKDFDKRVGDISFIFMDDEQLLKVNLQYLNHNFYTDVITFDYCKKNTVSGDIFISIDRIKENSYELKTPLKEEFLRVMIHGILHLLGYNDSSDKQKKEMRNKETYYIKRINIDEIEL